MPVPFAIEVERTRAGVVLKIDGELDLAVADQLRSALEPIGPEQTVILDLLACDFIDSTGLAVLVHCHQRQVAGGGKLLICSPGAQVQRVLKVSGLDSELVVVDRDKTLAD